MIFAFSYIFIGGKCYGVPVKTTLKGLVHIGRMIEQEV